MQLHFGNLNSTYIGKQKPQSIPSSLCDSVLNLAWSPGRRRQSNNTRIYHQSFQSATKKSNITCELNSKALMLSFHGRVSHSWVGQNRIYGILSALRLKPWLKLRRRLTAAQSNNVRRCPKEFYCIRRIQKHDAYLPSSPFAISRVSTHHYSMCDTSLTWSWDSTLIWIFKLVC